MCFFILGTSVKDGVLKTAATGLPGIPNLAYVALFVEV
jgi:hypothetical protein